MTQDQIDTINDELDPIADQEFNSWADAWQAVSLVLESHGIEIPTVSAFSEEMIFKLELDDQETDHYLYVATEDLADDDKYTLYATLATQEELDVIADFSDDVPADETDV